MNKKNPIVLLLIIIIGSNLLYAQDYTKLSYGLVKIIEEQKGQISRSSDYQIDLILKGNVTELANFINSHGGTVKYSIKNLLAARLPINKLEDLSKLPYLIKAESGIGSLQFHDEVAIEQTSVDTVHGGLGDLNQSYTGQGVVFGMIDSGIDPTHADFQNNDMTTRIIGFWDQSDTTGSFPPYGYGKVYSQQEINAGLMSNYLDSTYGGHGTAVAGVAVGGGRAHDDIKGMAPKADIVAVGINPHVLDYLDRTPSMLNIVDGVNYIYSIAESLGKPAVINISLGGIEGSHDGKDLPTQMIEAMIEQKSGRALVTSAGNSAQTKHHIQLAPNNDTLFTWFKTMYSNTEVCKRDSGAYMSFYADSSDFVNLKISISAEDRVPCCNILDQTGFRFMSDALPGPLTDTLWDGTQIVGIVTTYVEKIEDVYAYFMEIKSDDILPLWRVSVTGTGKLDGWAGPTSARSCNSEYILSAAFVGSSTQIDNYNNYVEPDNEQTIGTAYASSKNVITVGAYYSRQNMIDVDSIQRNYSVTPLQRATFSSIGPSRDLRIKPNIMGPGGRIVTAQASQVLTEKLSSARSTVYLGGNHSVTDGTSFASPAVAGIVALYLEKYPNANYIDIINALEIAADQESFMDTLPNNNYGHGNINAYQMLLTPPITSGLEIKSASNKLDGFVFPNPTTRDVNIVLPKNPNGSYHVQIYNLIGELILDEKSTGHHFKFPIQSKGTFIVNVTNEKGYSFVQKVVVI